MSSVDHKPSIPQHTMKTLGGAKWTLFGCILVVVGGAKSDTTVYSGRAALLAYSPARGEFPVQGLFGRGYFSYVDQDGNSKLVSLEPNPLLGVRVSASGEPLLEHGPNIALENQPKMHGQEQISRNQDGSGNIDRLKPIKEFDERPFVDEADVLLPGLTATNLLPKVDAVNESLPAATPSAVTSRQFVSNQGGAGSFSPTNPFLPLLFPDPSTPSNQGNLVNIPLPPGQGLTNLPPSNAGQNPFLQPNAGLVFSNPTPPSVFINPTPPSSLEQVFTNPSSGTISPSTASQSSISEIVFPNSPLITGSNIFSNTPLSPTIPTTTASPIIEILTTGTAFPEPLPTPSSPQIINTLIPSVATTPPPQYIGAGNVVISPSGLTTNPPSTSQGLLQNPLQPCSSTTMTGPSFITPNQQFIFDKRNPFLPQRTPERTTLTPSEIEAIVTNFDIKSSISGLYIRADIDDTAIPEQVTDTPEVAAAKREHFLAHELALSQLQLAQQQSDKENDSSLSSTSASDTSSVYLPSEAASASYQAVTSGPSTVVITEQMKVIAAGSNTVS